MSWEQSAYGFGTPNAQPPTPTKTPTSAQLPSPVFQTPRNNNSSFEDRTNWTPTFAEEYSVFNSTPGRLTGSHPTFADANTPRPLPTSTFDRRLSNADQIAAELATHVHHLSPNPNLPLPPVDPSVQLASSPGEFIAKFESQRNQITPRRPAKNIEDPFSGQTATPPASQSKGSRKLAPKLSSDKMQNDHHDSHFGMADTPTQASNMLDFPTTSPDFFTYPMSAPATAPVFTNTKPFWDTDQSMVGMDLDFNTDDTNMFSTSSHKIANSLDWGRNNQMFQDGVNNAGNLDKTMIPRTDQQPTKRPRPLAPKVDLSELLKNTPAIPEFEFHDPSHSRMQSANHVEEAINPANLWSLSNVSSSMAPPMEQISTSPSRPATSHAQLQPYSQQVRESLRDQEEYQQERMRARRRIERASASSPIRGARPGLQRSVSDSRARRSQERGSYRSAGRVSPLKRVTGLSSIPEAALGMRTEIKFVIDKNGRASTETIIVSDRPGSSYDEDFSQSTCSSDDEAPINLSRNTSFDLPQQGRPRISRLESGNREPNLVRRHSAHNSYSRSESSRSSYRSTRRDSLDSEAETIMDNDTTGDATQEIKKMMEARKQSQHRAPAASSRRHPTNLRPRPRYYAPSSTISPSTATEVDGATPSSIRSGTTRCVCKNPDIEGFMIQCESCDCWLHTDCVGIDQNKLPPVYICAFCAQTPNKRGPRVRDTARNNHITGASPLAHKSFQSFR